MAGISGQDITFHVYAPPYLISVPFGGGSIICSGLTVCEGVQPDVGMPLDKSRHHL